MYDKLKQIKLWKVSYLHECFIFYESDEIGLLLNLPKQQLKSPAVVFQFVTKF